MGKQCQFIEGCPMFKYFCRAAETIYRQVYCEGDYESCARRNLNLAGQPVPENLLPKGVNLWEEGETPPEQFLFS